MQLVEIKAAAAEIQHLLVAGQLGAEAVRQGVDMLLGGFLHLDAAGCLAGPWGSGAPLTAFTGKLLVPAGLVAEPRFLFAVVPGAGLAVNPGLVNCHQLWETFAPRCSSPRRW